MFNGIYLDNNTTTRPSDKTIAKMIPCFTETWGSPSAPHQMGQQVLPAMSQSYRLIYALLGANEKDHFVFTSSGAEAVNHVISSAYFDTVRQTGKNHFLTSQIDEAPSIMAIGKLEQLGCLGKMVKPNQFGVVTAEALSESITPRTAMISLSWANGLTGVINPISEIGKLCQERGIRFHVDATHVLGKISFELSEAHIHFLSFNGDQIHGPKGTGGLYIRAGVSCSPFILGGMEQAGQRAGSVNVAGLVGLGEAASEALDSRDLLCTEVARLRNHLERGIQDAVSDAIPFFQDQDRLPNCTAIAFPGIPNEAMLFSLNRKGVYASIGGGSFQQIGIVLAASGIDEVLAHTAISFSLSRETTEEEIDQTIEIVAVTAKKLRKLSEKFVVKA